ncbi:hypothetical protein [Salisediminibacterium halotolerans]|uniref:hypothetical protein n=1 Tax=Salisediminibacterium halotolerans TaxID=517425 RepID=UPI000EB47A42|nr:hypothetical protein [Salisediminibacterium halotolerans]RLJ74063.1 hypothetical protein BCL39_1347 [Actinophytocola xinjiangensis]RPE87844.1 hypothetical protein EDD67_1584 [Salisediminibacterium halotolerans]TWG34900.1 hypothetical protein BCL52_1344 [Salisediminibacterium halotolerans]GEL07912.1 hypothetical protein SHA02_13280 [Salisediminibacterium halotolerans]
MRDRLILTAIAGSAFLFLIFQFDLRSDLPYLTAVLILFALSFAIFIAFMNEFSRRWQLRLWIVNGTAALFVPIIEGMIYIWVTAIIWLLLIGSMSAFYILQSDQDKS